MIASSSLGLRKIRILRWPEVKATEESESRKGRVRRWLTPHWKNRAAVSLCRTCRNRKLDLRPLMVDPPSSYVIPENPENEDLNELEEKYTVYIYDFSIEKAKAAKSKCSLCALLCCCLGTTQQDGWLGYMSCVCMLRPRFDRSTNDGERGRIIHKQQVWVEFQPIEGEVLLDLIDIKPTGKRRTATPPTADIELLNYWLDNCDDKHSHPDVHDTIRSRMQTILDGKIFRLINTSTGLVEVLTSLPKFAALSYVWGCNSDQQKNRPLEGGPISEYSPTIRDSIVIARSIGYEWLWVDRLCIDQTSDSEKAELIPYMKDIYAAARLTIVAACGENAQSGLLGSQNTPRAGEKPLVIGPSVAVLPVCHQFENMISSTVWGNRGWTFQEHVFSRRLLFVLESEVFFSCGEHKFRESSGRRPVIDNQGPINRWLFSESGVSDAAKLQAIFGRNIGKTEDLLIAHQFISAIQAYSQRSLTFEEDRVSAFAGIVLAAMRPMDPTSEQAFLKHGHPLRFFEPLLSWRNGNFSRSFNSQVPILKSRFPSWSWASADRQVIVGRGRMASDYDLYCWFQYRQLPNHDILGFPTEYNKMAHLADLPLPDGLIEDQSWTQSLPDESKPSHGDGGSGIVPILTSVSPPKLHLLTLVFDARLVRCDTYYTDKHVLIPVGSTESSLDVIKRGNLRPDVMEEWSLRPESEDLFPKEGNSSRQQPFETFAVVTGNPYLGAWRGNVWSDEVHYHLYLMLLDPTGQPDTYSRLGINQIRNVHKDLYYSEVIRSGRPRWQYIHLV